MKTPKIKDAFANLKNKTQISDESNDLLVKKGNQLHIIILVLVAIIAVAYVLFDFIENNYTQAFISATILPSLVFSYWLYHTNRTALSKIWNLTHVTLIIGIQFLLQPPFSLALTLYLPVLLSTLIVFQGKDRKLGYLLAFLVFCVTIFLIKWGDLFRLNHLVRHETLETLRTINMTGAIGVTILEVLFLLKLNNSVQFELLEIGKNLNRNNEILASTIQTRDKMLSIISHDLRSPLIIIDSGLEVLQEDDFPEDKKKHLSLELRKRSKLTLNLIDNLLLWTRSQTDQIQYKSQPISTNQIGKIIQGFSDTYRGEKGVEMTFDLPETGAVNADKDMLEGILRNLISNALKFTPNGGKISIQIEPIGKRWRFVVQDSGVGIPSEVLEKLKNGDSISTTGTNKEKGHGLGLQLVRDFLLKHGSELRIESEPEKGTTFSFDLESA
ncbi:MAG TPA: HAMP domain-containing sensor histidine kinase [Flavobacteriales bacterium]|nr:HAMP domain-containing sensor histidine kinase [Flavobacteriales bacterium]HPH83302.1 HAMP domain-containing sensor histidine kinase [Flavobacteriales bacterium]